MATLLLLLAALGPTTAQLTTTASSLLLPQTAPQPATPASQILTDSSSSSTTTFPPSTTVTPAGASPSLTTGTPDPSCSSLNLSGLLPVPTPTNPALTSALQSWADSSDVPAATTGTGTATDALPWCAVTTALPSSLTDDFGSYVSAASSWSAAHSAVLAEMLRCEEEEDDEDTSGDDDDDDDGQGEGEDDGVEDQIPVGETLAVYDAWLYASCATGTGSSSTSGGAGAKKTSTSAGGASGTGPTKTGLDGAAKTGAAAVGGRNKNLAGVVAVGAGLVLAAL